MNKKIKLMIGLIVVLVFAGAVFIYAKPSNPATKVGNVVIDQSASNTNTPDSTNTPNVPAVDVPKTTNKALKYKNGTYSVTSSYDSPAGMEDIGVSLTIKNDIVTGATFTPMANDRRSSMYQNSFASSFKSYVVGKSIDSVNLDVVSGASLTSAGFNAALEQIKTKAQA